MESLNEDISKLNRAANVMQEAHQQTLDDLLREEEKVSSLSKAKLKLERQVDEVGSVVSCWLAVYMYANFCFLLNLSWQFGENLVAWLVSLIFRNRGLFVSWCALNHYRITEAPACNPSVFKCNLHTTLGSGKRTLRGIIKSYPCKWWLVPIAPAEPGVLPDRHAGSVLDTSV